MSVKRILKPSAAVAALLMLLVFPAPPAFCADKPKAPAGAEKMLKSGSPLHVSGDRMEVRQQERTLVFEGHVIVQQDDVTLTGNRLKITAAAGGKSEPSAIVEKIDHIEVEGDVKISQQDRLATADRAVFYHQEQKIVMTGNPTVSRGKDKIHGKLITIYLSQGRSVIEGGEDAPVEAVLYPKKD